MGEERGCRCSQVSESERSAGGSDEGKAASHLSSSGLSQPLDAVMNVPRSPNGSSSSLSGESRDLVSERTPESSLAEQELLSPLQSEWKSADDRELGVTSGKERLLLRLGAASLAVTSPGVDAAVTSEPGDSILLARFRFKEGGGGSSLGMTHFSSRLAEFLSVNGTISLPELSLFSAVTLALMKGSRSPLTETSGLVLFSRFRRFR